MTIKAAIVCLSESFGYFNYSTFPRISKDGILPMNPKSGRYRFHFFCAAAQIGFIAFVFPEASAALTK
jgi:hypothetical protein